MASCVPDTLDKVVQENDRNECNAVPVVDEEIMALMKEIREKKKLLTEVEVKLEKNMETRWMTDEALKGLDHELRNTEALIVLKKREEEIQNDLAAIADRKKGVLSNRITRMRTELKCIGERKESLENHIYKTERKLEEFKENMKWDQQTMEAFLKKSAQQNEETMAVLKYAHKDDQRVKSLTLAIEKMTLEVNDKRKALEKAQIENKCLQFALDKGTENLQKAYQETQELTQLVEDTINQRKQRDAEMQKCTQQLAQANEKYRENISTLTDNKQLFNTLKKNNQETKRKRDTLKHESIKLRQELAEEEINFRNLQDEVNLHQRELHKAAANVKSLKSDISQMKKAIQENNEKLMKEEANNAALEEKLKVVTQTAQTEEERAAQMDQCLKNEEQMVKELDALLRTTSKDFFFATQHLEAVKAKEKDLISHVSNSKSTLTNQYNQQQKLEKILRRQKATVLEQSAQIDLLNEKLAHLQGHLPTADKDILENKISEVTQIREEKKETAMMLHNALRESENALRHLKKELDKSETQKGDLISTVDQLMQRCDGKENNLTTLRMKKEESMVRCQVLKTEVDRLSNLLNSKEDSVLSSEKRRLELQRAIKEREDEIKIQRDTLHRQLNLSDQERQKLSLELSEKLRKIDIMKKRFEVMTISMSVPVEENESAQAYIITKVALESEELRQKDGALDAEIRKAESENKALENGNSLFSHHNSHLRQAFHKMDESSAEFQEKLWLEEQVTAAEAMLRSKEKQIEELQEDLQEKKNILEILLKEEEDEKEKIKDKQQPIAKLNKEISSQLEKINRATKQCAKLIKQIRSANGTNCETFEEKDIMLKEFREFSRSFDKMLSETMEKNPELQLVLAKYFQQASISLPAPSSTMNSSHGSKVGSASNLASFRSTVSSASSRSTSTALSCPVNVIDLTSGLPQTKVTSKCPSAASSRSSKSSKMHA